VGMSFARRESAGRSRAAAAPDIRGAAVPFLEHGLASLNYHEEGAMSPEKKTLLTTAFEALGPERVTRGLKATGHSWRDCFLAVAIYGEPDALARQLEKRWRKEHFVGTLLDLRVHVVNEVVRAWDHDEGTFRTLALEWLELNRAAVVTQNAMIT